MPVNRERKRVNPKRKEARLKRLGGWRVEDVWIAKYPDWEPHLQAIEHDNGKTSLRYCYYKKTKAGKTWAPIPSFLYEETIDDFRREIKKAKATQVEALLRRLVGN